MATVALCLLSQQTCVCSTCLKRSIESVETRIGI